MQIQPLEKLGPGEDPTAAGNVGLFIKPDGGIRLFNCFGKREASELTAIEVEACETVFALTVALRVPGIMDTLRRMANDPEIIGARSN